ncbi:hypothetical protein CBR_g52670 [Chara braunii]|uniref:Uncharacterized protein n=1 Tax=Chara braunii TaxID=69332 RepID=A0A388MAQ2_CHABU|nr:hypothetical protein CBR_g52670 [Chara braunii]|eukprot:GBG91636.1 hypothetical protein CBR_g52670 [Chara braunii]
MLEMAKIEDAQSGTNVLLDFRTAFCGSVFEKYHILPVQVASLDVHPVAIKPEGMFFCNLRDFLLLPGNVDLLTTDGDSFIKRFADFENAGADITDCCAAAAIASQFWTTTRRRQDIRDEQGEIRSGSDVTRESDVALALKMFNFLRNKTIFGEVSELHALTHLIDFDLVGADNRRFPLRMLMWDDYRGWNVEGGWRSGTARRTSWSPKQMVVPSGGIRPMRQSSRFWLRKPWSNGISHTAMFLRCKECRDVSASLISMGNRQWNFVKGTSLTSMVHGRRRDL